MNADVRSVERSTRTLTARTHAPMPDPEKLLTHDPPRDRAVPRDPGPPGGVITLETAEEVMVVGDLHGNIPAFKQGAELAALDQQSRRGTSSSRSWSTGKLMYPDDGGDRSHQLVDLVAALKCQYPDRVHLILGNHELSELTGRIIGKDGEALNLHVPPGDRDGLRRARPTTIYEAYKSSSPPCRWPSARRTGCSSATRSPTRTTSTRSTSSSSRPTPGRPRR